MKKFIIIAFSSFYIFIVGCGGGGGSKTSTIFYETVDLNVSTYITKVAYLPNFGADGSYSLTVPSATGETALLDAVEGEFSYLTSAASPSQDSFIYRVQDSSGDITQVAVTVNVVQIPVMTNDGTQDDINTSSPQMLEGKELVDFSSNLPVMVIDVADQEIPDEPKVPGTVVLFEPDGTGRTSLSTAPTKRCYMEIERRGSSSQIVYPKKQYGMDTTWCEETDDEDISWLGLPAEHKWILQAPYGDKSLMRNYLAYHKTREIDESKYYAVRSQYVELLTRVGSQYRYEGVYILMEKIKRDGDRLDITKLKEEDVLPPEVTGGYILKQDGEHDPDEFYFNTPSGTEIIVIEPDLEDLQPEQQYYIENYVQSFETALMQSDFNVTSSQNYYGNWIDVESFIVHMLSREFFMDVDTWLFSEYFHKDRDKNLSMTPVWDFNAGMGNNDYRLVGRTDGWVFDIIKDDFPGYSVRYWMERLMSDPAFRAQARAKWQELRSTIWSDANLSTFITDTQTLLSEGAQRNFERWPNVLGVYVWPNRMACDDGGPVYCPTFDSAVNEHLKTWLLDRAAWIDSYI